jgi:hypothetical protein
MAAFAAAGFKNPRHGPGAASTGGGLATPGGRTEVRDHLLGGCFGKKLAGFGKLLDGGLKITKGAKT